MDDSPCQVSIEKEVERQCFWGCDKSQGVIEEGIGAHCSKSYELGSITLRLQELWSGGAEWIISLKGKTNHSLSWTRVFYVVWINFSQNFVKMIVTRSLCSKISIEKNIASTQWNRSYAGLSLSKIKKTASGPDNIPCWVWRDKALLLAPVVTFIGTYPCAPIDGLRHGKSLTSVTSPTWTHLRNTRTFVVLT